MEIIATLIIIVCLPAIVLLHFLILEQVTLTREETKFLKGEVKERSKQIISGISEIPMDLMKNLQETKIKN